MVRGADWSKKSNKWRARLKHNYREYVAGYFDTVAEPEQAIIDLRNKLFTHNDEDRQEAPRKAA
ncbi:hypothetical protein [Sediminivirga luteola]|uniref:Uncharacterized protein n=1 Tax=Sediminivirga luteola TaxID=1774748 RepID=A0A8J2XK16_9MICO|nr:hypothetical protein [Sediminivirga luteola]GGA10764.1 hypothetical protein GCM10011333_11980 [Sediminivirga luteola]